jgi:PAS domain S-box-containing protein
MKITVRALRNKYSLFIVSVIGIVALQVMLEYWFDQESTFSLILSACMVLILICEFVFIFLPSLRRLSAINRKLVSLRKQLSIRERQYRELVEGATDIIYELDSGGRFTFVNEVMLNMSGYTQEEMIGRLYGDLIHPEDRTYAAQFYRDQLKTGTEISYLEFRMIGKHGQVAWIGQNVRYFYDGAWVSSVRVVARDITQGRQAQLALQKTKEEAEQATRAKSQFLSMMSHEIRTPMNAIIGLTNLLADSKLTEEQRANVALLKFSGENLLTIINDILDFSKIEARKIVLESIDVDIRELIRQTIQIQQPRAFEKSIRLSYAVDSAIPLYLKADPVRLIQVLTNLVSNGIKFTHEGSVMLEAKLLSKKDEDVTLILSVADTGIGIEANKLNSIFESFSQAEDATTRKYGGTGLGLAITRKLVELMGGTITVDSTYGQGATFTCTLTLPVGKEPVTAETESIDALAVPAGGMVLLAEDNTMNQLVVISFLRKWNVESMIAVNGSEALALIKRKTFDLVLMDLQMPEMSGYEVTQRIRAMDDPYFKHVPIIALTASAMAEVKDRVLATGMNDFLSKPFQPQELKRILAKYLDRKRDSAQTVGRQVSEEDEMNSILQSARDNLAELQTAFEKFVRDNNPDVFSAAAHKCRMTLTFIDDAIVQQYVNDILEAIRNNASLTLEMAEGFRSSVQVAIENIAERLKV